RTAMLFRPLRVFIPLALVFLSYGLIKMGVDLVRDPNISASATFAMMGTLLIVLIGMLGDAISTRLARLNQNPVVGVRARDTIELEPEPVDSLLTEPAIPDAVIYSLAADDLLSSGRIK
ncbi:MAG: hypothetical protein ACRD68_04385, partial [Pyrinomonadaceae bacterium]